MQQDIAHVAGSIHYCYTNVRPCDLMEIIAAMGGEGRAGMWLDGNNKESLSNSNFDLNARRQLLLEDSKLSNEELQKKYRLSTMTSDLTESVVDRWLSGLITIDPNLHIKPLECLHKHLSEDVELVKILRQQLNIEFEKLTPRSLLPSELPNDVANTLTKELLSNALIVDLIRLVLSQKTKPNPTTPAMILRGIDELLVKWFAPVHNPDLVDGRLWKHRILDSKTYALGDTLLENGVANPTKDSD